MLIMREWGINSDYKVGILSNWEYDATNMGKALWLRSWPKGNFIYLFFFFKKAASIIMILWFNVFL